jgi:hypothetical protein
MEWKFEEIIMNNFMCIADVAEHVLSMAIGKSLTENGMLAIN